MATAEHIATDNFETLYFQLRKKEENISNLNFIYGDPESNLKEKKIDSIIFAASIQYFESFEEIIQKALRLLKPNGEIHILDSHFYSMSELGAAIERSKLYFEGAGFPEMSQHYFHHTLDSVANFNYRFLYNPNSLLNRFLKNKKPFYWIQIQA